MRKLCALTVLTAWGLCAAEESGQGEVSPTSVIIEFTRNRVEVLRTGATIWDAASTNANYNRLHPGDQLRTGDASRAGLRLPGHRSTLILDSNSRLLIPAAETKGTLNLLKGRLFNFHRGPIDEQRVLTPTVSAIVRGTGFTVEVDDAGTTSVQILDGEVLLENEHGSLTIGSGEQAVVPVGQAPRKAALLVPMEAIQWCLYYPAILDVEDVPFEEAQRIDLRESLQAYAAGNLLQAYESLPPQWRSGSPAMQLFGAAVLLGVGEVDEAERTFSTSQRSAGTDPSAQRLVRLQSALQSMIRIVRLETNANTLSISLEAPLPTECMVESYRLQAAGSMEEALSWAQRAVQNNPDFGFGWARVAELEFGFGRIGRTDRALEKALRLSPQNAQAVALNGFIMAARNRNHEAVREFDQAITLDPTLANGWLGRGLCRFRLRQRKLGLDDLQMAATVEPQRSLLRSYLGKALGDTGDYPRAFQELELAKQLDSGDPTPWLYSALLLYNEYRTAEAIWELEKSQELNKNRAVFRSRLLLDQDRAVRSANLAHILADAGMEDVSVRESACAVSYDYANFSAHLNLASSFDQLRDPTRFNLRYESEWFNEHLLASLLSPVGAGSLSQNLSQQEYSRLFEHNKLGLTSSTTYRSDGQLRQLASQYGNIGNTAWALDLDYQHNDGVRPNNDLDRLEWYTRIKQQVGLKDSALVLLKYQDYESGDNFQYYDPNESSRPDYRFRETQMPLALAGWHHEWSPGVHTLLLGGRLENQQEVDDKGLGQIVAILPTVNASFNPRTNAFDIDYQSDFEIYSAELNQIFQRKKHTDILGVRFQSGRINAQTSLDSPQWGTNYFTLPEVSATDASFDRVTLYAYHHWEVVDNLMLIGGLAYDSLNYPANFRRPPLESSEAHTEHLLPKGALIWDLTERVRLRGMFSEQVGGVSFEDSIRLEPTQLAGFAQSYRSLISESLVGSVEAPLYWIAGGALDVHPGNNTWLSLQVDWRSEEVTRDFGVFNISLPSTSSEPANTLEELDYQEWQARAVLNQILGRQWFLGAGYQFTYSTLERTWPTIVASSNFDRTSFLTAALHEADLAAEWRSPSGLFARGELRWFAQDLGGDGHRPPGDCFGQVNLFAGYRFPKRHGELTVGVLNLTDEDYQLDPLNYYLELPRERALYVRLQLNF